MSTAVRRSGGFSLSYIRSHKFASVPSLMIASVLALAFALLA
jgi:hypothetical protein